MNTQTGGRGETIQSAPETSVAPEQFAANIPPVPQEDVSAEQEIVPPVTPAPTPVPEQVAEEVPIENPNKDNILFQTEEPVIEEPIISSEVGEPVIGPQTEWDFTFGKDLANIPSATELMDLSDDDDVKLGISNPYAPAVQMNLTPDSEYFMNPFSPVNMPSSMPSDEEDPVFFSENERIKYNLDKVESKLSDSTRAMLRTADDLNKQFSIQRKDNNARMSGNINPDSRYASIVKGADKALSSETYKGTEFERVTKDVEYSPSKNLVTYSNLMGMTLSDVDEMAYSALGAPVDDKFESYKNDLRAVNMNYTKIENLEKALQTGETVKPDGVSFPVSSKTPEGRKQIQKQIDTIKKENDVMNSRIESMSYKDVRNEAILAPQTSDIDLVTQFEKTTNKQLKAVYNDSWEYYTGTDGKRYFKQPYAQWRAQDYDTGIEALGGGKNVGVMTYNEMVKAKAYAKWLDTTGKDLISKDINNGTKTFLSSRQKKFPDMGTGVFSTYNDYEQDLYSIEAKKRYEKTKSVDYYSYSGWKEEAKEVSKESSSALNTKVKEVSIQVVDRAKAEEQKWVESNKPVMAKKINDIKTSMDKVFYEDLMNKVSANPELQSMYDKYTSDIQMQDDKAEAKRLSNELMSNLKASPLLKKSFSEYEENLNKATTKVLYDYSDEYSAKKREIYITSIEDLKAELISSTREVYKTGVNNDLNIYLNADKIVKSERFKNAGFYEKREIIAQAWITEKVIITTHAQQGIKRYPKNEEEASKHWGEWTGIKVMTAEEKAKALKELPSRTSQDAKNRFIFYAVDELLYNPKGTQTPYAIKAFASDQLQEIRAKEKMLGINYDDAKSNKMPISQDDLKKMQMTKQYLNKIIATPDTDESFFSDLANGFSDGFEIPFIGSLIGISKNTLLKNAMDKYSSGALNAYDISLVDAYAALNEINKIKPDSWGYDIGSGLGATSTFMLEMMATGGLNTFGRTAGIKLVDRIASVGTKYADDAVRISVEKAIQNPELLTKTQKIVGFLSGAMVEGTVNPQYIEMTTERMIDSVTIQESGAYDGLVAKIDANSGEGGIEAFMKSYGSWVSMQTIERLGGHMPKTGVTKEVLEYMGTSTFVKRSLVGRMMRDFGFKTVDEATDFLATQKMPWDGLLAEYGEEMLQNGAGALITGDKPVFGLDDNGEYNFLGTTGKEAAVTAGVVSAFGGLSATATNVKATIKGEDVTIESTTADGTHVASIPRAQWSTFNKALSDKSLDWKGVMSILNMTELDANQEAAMVNVALKMRGAEITQDADYQEWKKTNEAQIELNEKVDTATKEAKAQQVDERTPEQKAIEEYDFGTKDRGEDPVANLYGLIMMNEENMNPESLTIEEEKEDGTKEAVDVVTEANAIAESANNRKGKIKKVKADNKAKNKKENPAEKTEATPEPSSFETPIDLSTPEAPTVEAPKNKRGIATKKSTAKAVEQPKIEPVPDVLAPTTEWEVNTQTPTENDKENITGIPSQVGEGQEPIQTQPVTQASEEAPSTSGVVQEEQVAPTEGKALEVHVGGIERGFTQSEESKGKSVGDIRTKIESESNDYGTIVTKGATNGETENDTFVVAYSKIGGDGQRILETSSGSARPGWVSTSVKISENATEQEIAEAKNAAIAKMNEILPSIKGGKFSLSNVNTSTSATTETAQETTPAEAQSAPTENLEVGSNISLKDYETEKVGGHTLKVGDVYVRNIDGTRYVYRLLESPRRDRSRGNFWNARVEVLSIGNTNNEKNSKYGIKPLNVGDTRLDIFKSSDKSSSKFGNVSKINNWKEAKAETQTAPQADIFAEETAPTEAKTAQSTSEKYQEAKQIGRISPRSVKRKQAEAKFNAKHGDGAFERVSKIDSNFDKIVAQLEDNKIIKKEC